MNSAFRLWQLISPTLPVGAFSYSQALEYVIESGTVRDEPTALAWIGRILEHSLASNDLPVLLRVHAAHARGDFAGIRNLSEELAAMRETSELRLEDSTMGNALAQLLTKLGVPVPDHDLPFACAFAVAAAHWGITAEDACAGFAWTWCEAQVAAAVKLVPLGHTAGQRMLLTLGERIVPAVEQAAACTDDEIGSSLPGFALASALHETQYTRLFRS